MDQPTIHQVVRSLVDAGHSPEQVGDIVMADPNNFFLFRSLVVAVAKNCRRTGVRAIEAAVYKAIRGAPTLTHARQVWRQFKETDGLDLPDGRHIDCWLDATAADHRSYAKWCRGQARGLLDTAEVHEAAARDIEAADVRCLRDLIDLDSKDDTDESDDEAAA